MERRGRGVSAENKNAMKRAVLIGAGQFGRGGIARILEKAGYHVVLTDINRAVIEDINRRGGYTVRCVDDGSCTEIRNVTAMLSSDPKLIGEMQDCDLICTCVGLLALEKVAPLIAEGLIARRRAEKKETLNILACENAIGNTSTLKRHIFEDLAEEERIYVETHVGFPDCAIDSIIPPVQEAAPADVSVESYCEWDALKGGFKGEIPAIDGLVIVEDLTPYIERKLFTLNGPNAVTGCYGWLKGYETVQEALADPEIFELVHRMMVEAGEMLSLRHGFSSEEMMQYRTSIMERFRNPRIPDRCERVAREPIRKLSPFDRITAPMNYALELGLDPEAYYKGIAAVMAYDNPAEEQSAEIQRRIRETGFQRALESICGIAAEGSVSRKVEQEYESLLSEIRNR